MSGVKERNEDVNGCAYEDKRVIPVKKIEDVIKEVEENAYWDFLEQRDADKTLDILQQLKKESCKEE